MDRAKLGKQIHETAKEKGWWDEGEDRNVSEIYALIITELSEGIEADRENRTANIESFNDILSKYKEEWIETEGEYFTKEHWHKVNFEGIIKDTIGDELADAWIRCIDWLFYRHREYMNIIEFSHTFEDNFASGIFDIMKEVTSLRINGAVYLIEKFCEKHDIDLEWHVKQKMKYNGMRPKKHGGKKY